MLFSLYALTDAEHPITYVTPLPQVDSRYWLTKGKSITWLSRPMPLGKLVPLKDDLFKALGRGTSFLDRVNLFLGKSGARKGLVDIAATIFGEVKAPHTKENVVLPSAEEKSLLLTRLQGRMLFPEEIKRALGEQAVSLATPYLETLQILYLEDKVEMFPGVVDFPTGQRCIRCGEKIKLLAASCASCGEEECYYCDSCNIMGQARVCQVLYAIPQQDEKVARSVHLNLDFELTKPQQDAFAGVEHFVQEDKSLGVVWAACGAGKTEVSFGAIRETLAKGGKVLYAIPRKDVVIELEPRLRKAFPGCSIVALYGGSGTKYQEADLVIATTHQCLRFFRRFDLVVLDEADAFPYDGSAMLYHAVERARAFEGKIIYMSATPSDEMLTWLKNGKASGYTIPARYHGFPLPEPALLIDKKLSYGTKSENITLPETAIDFIIKSVEDAKAQVFVFVPTVASAQPTAELLRRKLAHKPFVISYSYARDEERDKKRRDFSEGRTDIFVTTSIMERGITITRANVLVLFADFDKIYSWRTLVQMAGRTGRTLDYPRGVVCFAAKTKSQAMEDAVQAIAKMNKEAMEKGYLRK